MTIDTDTAGIAAAMLPSFTTLAAASWAMRERARSAGYRRAARHRKAAVRWLHFRLATSRCEHLPPAEARPSRMRQSTIPSGRGSGAHRSHQIRLRHITRTPRCHEGRR